MEDSGKDRIKREGQVRCTQLYILRKISRKKSLISVKLILTQISSELKLRHFWTWIQSCSEFDQDIPRFGPNFSCLEVLSFHQNDYPLVFRSIFILFVIISIVLTQVNFKLESSSNPSRKIGTVFVLKYRTNLCLQANTNSSDFTLE
ncbi:hypothetical protein PV325_000875 [Microctonus aethiopoides]|uniref:Uncharacterized protein n=1 Tax=Microctonus aethiopoides TaxID=144406 RepID=A0AA39KL91_9HYME|nr:hypothetical protein PV325_000875 [Microctonus aethiopoides]KAK0091082.1 hypothetical protein PV326_003780 [Microctonus aethiopoides]KAK0165625.1 hypothetical protein PV328_004127 [Microctonus aethiopoides]